MNIQAAIYARVSCEKQVQDNTINSQITALEERVKADGFYITNDNKFIDNGYSGTNLIRPELERMRDNAAMGEINYIYVHSPDRLARKYAYQVILLEEFSRLGIEVIFLNCKIEDNPEAQLLLQMQGMISEYERAKIIERHRRGKLHAAKRGSVSVLGGAPYGYRYITKSEGGGEASIVIVDYEAEAVKRIFNWIGRDRLSIDAICYRLREANYKTRYNKDYWHRGVICRMLKNPIYMGKAAFGKTKKGAMLPRIRPPKHSSSQPKKAYSTYQVAKDKWIYISTPAIIEEGLFDIVQQQLEENKKRARVRKKGATYLLQGLVVCKHCQYAYFGKPARNRGCNKIDSYGYYRCIGAEGHRFGGVKVCNSKSVRADALEMVVWKEVQHLLKNPNLIADECERRINNLDNNYAKTAAEILEQKIKKFESCTKRLIDSYAEGLIEKSEFKPRIEEFKRKTENIKKEQAQIINNENAIQEIKCVITSLENFAMTVKNNLEQVDWIKRRDIIRVLVKCIEISKESINIVFKIKTPSQSSNPRNGNKSENLQHCRRSIYARLGCSTK
jgi:site-specific DNA recombinase